MDTEQRMSAFTALAIETFAQLLRAERRVTTLTNELHGYVRSIPANEMAEYMRQTTEMER